MKIESLLDELYSYSLHGIKLGLDNIQKICDKLGNPEKSYKTIHITGTNGKGSTATILETILLGAGKKVGKYTSPHILEFNERIRVDEKNISDEEIKTYYKKIKDAIEELKITPTFFEVTTAMMFLYFKDMGVEYAVIEVGMGGRFDATNIVESSIAIITNVSIDHTDYLGKTIYDISCEKAGIIKSSSKVIVADKNSDFLRAIEEKTSVYTNVLEKYSHVKYNLDFSNFITRIKLDNKDYDLSLFGDYQVNNFLCAYEAAKILEIEEEIIESSIKKVVWQCRFEVYNKSPLTIVEGAHNISGVENLKKIVSQNFKKNEVSLVVSILKDKEVEKMLESLEDISDEIILTSLESNHRGLSGDDLYKKVENKKNYIVENNMKLAYEKAKKSERKIIIICGSFYTCELFKKGGF